MGASHPSIRPAILQPMWKLPPSPLLARRRTASHWLPSCWLGEGHRLLLHPTPACLPALPSAPCSQAVAHRKLSFQSTASPRQAALRLLLGLQRCSRCAFQLASNTVQGPPPKLRWLPLPGCVIEAALIVAVMRDREDSHIRRRMRMD